MSGAYASNSEVIPRLWEQHEEIRSLELSRLKRAYDEGTSSGPGRVIDAETLLGEIKAKTRLR